MAFILQNQPNAYGIHGARSPILYKYSGATSGHTYQFDCYLTTGATGDLFAYATINRERDIDGNIYFDISTFIRNFLKDNMSFVNDNICYFQIIAHEIIINDDGTMAEKLVNSNVCKGSLGYTKYTDGVNYTDETTQVDYLMNYYLTGQTYRIYNYTGSTVLSWRDNDINTGYKILFTTTGGVDGNEQASFGTISVAKDEVARISFSAAALNYTTTTTTPAP